MRLKLIACEILFRELCAAVARSPNRVDLEFLPKGLHDIGQTGMTARLAEALAAVDESKYDAVAARLRPVQQRRGRPGRPRRSPWSFPAATIASPSSSAARSATSTTSAPIRASTSRPPAGSSAARAWSSIAAESIGQKAGMTQSYEELVAKYGEDNARFLREELANMTRHYSKLTFIEMGIEPDDRFERLSRRAGGRARLAVREGPRRHESARRRWSTGRGTRSGFCVVPPGQRIAASFDEGIIKAVRAVGLPEETSGNACGSSSDGQIEIDVQLRPVQVKPVEQLHFQDFAQPGVAEPGEVLVGEEILLVCTRTQSPSRDTLVTSTSEVFFPSSVRFHRAAPR